MTILDEAKALVFGDRQHDYGHPRADFARTAAMWAAILDCDVNPEQVAMCMICVKLSRERNAHKRDNAVDIAGYAQTLQMVAGEEP